MTREIERVADIPVVQIATIVPIMLTVGTNRIVPGVAIPHPVGDPLKGPEADRAIRRKVLLKALDALQTEIQEQTIFESPFASARVRVGAIHGPGAAVTQPPRLFASRE